MKLKFLYRFSKKAQISSFIKIPSVGAELFHTEGQTNMTKLTVDFGALKIALRKVIIHFILAHTIARNNFVTSSRCESFMPIKTTLSHG